MITYQSLPIVIRAKFTCFTLICMVLPNNYRFMITMPFSVPLSQTQFPSDTQTFLLRLKRQICGFPSRGSMEAPPSEVRTACFAPSYHCCLSKCHPSPKGLLWLQPSILRAHLSITSHSFSFFLAQDTTYHFSFLVYCLPHLPWKCKPLQASFIV